jgi:hypothetical protein
MLVIRKRLFILVGFVFAFVVLGLSMTVDLKCERDEFLAKLTRDCAQLMYFCTTMAGIFNLATQVKLTNGWLTLDMLIIGILAFCCLLMSFSYLQKRLHDNVLALVHFTANFAAFFYLAMIHQVWRDEVEATKKDKYLV